MVKAKKAVLAEAIPEFYICSLSCRSVIYKGLFLAEQLTAFFPDLLDELFVSNFAIYHQRYSTNTFPLWWLAQPFRVLAHNGEINTLLGNVNWMRSHETRMADRRFGDHIADIKPVVQPGSSDSAALDAVFELLVRTERELVAPLIEETLRIDTPVQLLARTCTQAIELDGVPIEVGDRVLFSVAAAKKAATAKKTVT